MAANPKTWGALAAAGRTAWRNREVVRGFAETLVDKHKATDHARTLADGRISHEYIAGAKHWIVWAGDTPVRAYPPVDAQTEANLTTLLADSRPGNRKRPDELPSARARQAASDAARKGALAAREAAKRSGPSAKGAAGKSVSSAQEAARRGAEAARQSYGSARSAVDRRRDDDHDATV